MQTCYNLNPIDPTTQETDLLHYQINLDQLSKSDEAKKNPSKAGCLAMCPPDEIYQRSEVEIGAMSNFESTAQGTHFDKFAVKRFDRRAAGKIAQC